MYHLNVRLNVLPGSSAHYSAIVTSNELVLTTLNLIGGKWKPILLHMLSSGTMRFGELKKNIPPVSQKMLTQQLRELEADGIISRKVYAEVPPKVEYSLTKRGITLKPILATLYAWGQENPAD